MFRLNLSKYEVPYERWEASDGKRELKRGTEEFLIRQALSEILRIAGVYQNGVEVVDGVLLAKQIRDCKEDFINIEDKDIELLRRIFNKLIAREHNPAIGQIALGGSYYEELILRVFQAEKVV